MRRGEWERYWGRAQKREGHWTLHSCSKPHTDTVWLLKWTHHQYGTLVQNFAGSRATVLMTISWNGVHEIWRRQVKVWCVNVCVWVCVCGGGRDKSVRRCEGKCTRLHKGECESEREVREKETWGETDFESWISLMPFIESLHKDLKTKKQSFCSMWVNWTCPTLATPVAEGEAGGSCADVGRVSRDSPWSEQIDWASSAGRLDVRLGATSGVCVAFRSMLSRGFIPFMVSWISMAQIILRNSCMT